MWHKKMYKKTYKKVGQRGNLVELVGCFIKLLYRLKIMTDYFD